MGPIEDIENAQSYWLRQAKNDLLQRDPVDDAEALAAFAQKRLDALMPEYFN